jgi:hypothetical protein
MSKSYLCCATSTPQIEKKIFFCYSGPSAATGETGLRSDREEEGSRLIGHGGKLLTYGKDQFRPSGLLPSVADPDPRAGAFLTPGSGIRDGEKSESGMNIPNRRELRNNFLGLKYLNSLMRIRIRYLLDPGSGMKNRIRDQE